MTHAAELADIYELEPPANIKPVPGKSLARATPYEWTDPASIPRREFLYNRHFIRRFASATVAAGAVGKTQLLVTEICVMTSGRDLFKRGHRGQPLRVWYYNLEDPREEITRRIQATAKHHGLRPDDLGDRLFLDSGREQPCIVAHTNRGSTVVNRPFMNSIIEEIEARQIDVLIIDPFVSCHSVSENDNSAIDTVAKEWVRVADAGNCAVELVHHTRKQGADEFTAESARGAKAVVEAARAVRVLNRMTEAEGEKAGVTNHRSYFRVYSDKLNLAPPLEKSDWYHFESIDLGQGDNVGVVEAWQFPDAMAGMTVDDLLKVQRVVAGGRYRQNAQSPTWVGKAVAEALGLNKSNPADCSKIKSMIRTWLASGALVVVTGPDEQRKPKEFIEVGQWAT